MKIAYRRVSGKIITSEQDCGSRGSWFEKRKAVFEFLRGRGHKVDLVSPLSKNSSNKDWQKTIPYSAEEKYDAVVFEFAGLNKVFFEKDLEETARIAREHSGICVFICDDPDLPFLWDVVSKTSRQRWFALYNAKYPKKVSIGKQPDFVESLDLPLPLLEAGVAGFMKPQAYSLEQLQSKSLVYFGRPNGREKVLSSVLSTPGVGLRIFGKDADWVSIKEKYGVRIHEPPTQDQRRLWYSQQLASVVLADEKHKRFGWRTGRASHALLAGCPAIVEKSHTALIEEGCFSFGSGIDLRRIAQNLRINPEQRRSLWEGSMQQMLESQKGVLERTLQRVGL